MSTAGINVAGMLPGMVAGAAFLEFDRRRSVNERARKATLAPGVGGILVGLVWPLAAIVAAVFGLVVLVAQCGRTIVDLLPSGREAA